MQSRIQARPSSAALLVLAISACSKPQSIQDSSPAIRDVNITGPNINIRVEQETRLSESSVIPEVGMIVEDVAKALKNGVPGPTPETKRVVFDVRFGKPSGESGFASDRFGTITFPIDALKSFKPGGLSALNLAESYEPGSGLSAEDGLKSCIDGGAFVSISQRFCKIIIDKYNK